MERLTVTVPEVARLLGISRMTAYAAVRDGTIPNLRIGRRVLVSRAALDRWLAKTDGEDTVPSDNGDKALHPEHINELRDIAR